MNIISLGAGVQSSTMALLAAKGEISPMPEAAIFADTQAEPRSVYTWLDWLETQLPFPVYRTTYRSLWDEELIVRRSRKSGRVYRKSAIPAFGSKGGMFPRKCTRDFKINPIQKLARALAVVPRQANSIWVTQWIGISVDEVSRMKDSPLPWIDHRWPLIELGFSRQDCLTWMADHGFPRPPRSACVFCPYHNDQEWLRLKVDEPEEFNKAVMFEQALQEAALRDEVTVQLPFLHAKRIPLDEVVFNATDNSKQFINECEGMCGV